MIMIRANSTILPVWQNFNVHVDKRPFRCLQLRRMGQFEAFEWSEDPTAPEPVSIRTQEFLHDNCQGDSENFFKPKQRVVSKQPNPEAQQNIDERDARKLMLVDIYLIIKSSRVVPAEVLSPILTLGATSL